MDRSRFDRFDDPGDRLPALVRNLQIIVGSLTSGALTFLIIAIIKSVFIDEGVERGEMELMAYLAFGFATVALVARAVVPHIVTLAGRRHIIRRESSSGLVAISTDKRSRPVPVVDALLNLYVTRTIIGAAIIEGAAFFALVVAIIEQQRYCLMLGGVMIIGIALHFPTRARVTQWLETQQMMLKEERQLLAQRGL
ncbi:MAG: hypothetical protein R3C10_07860 [Pirellulales bacterium]